MNFYLYNDFISLSRTLDPLKILRISIGREIDKNLVEVGYII